MLFRIRYKKDNVYQVAISETCLRRNAKVPAKVFRYDRFPSCTGRSMKAKF